ncbi:hypothetical protein V6N13_095151 [Hibiscus sabdariffa]
MQFSWECHHYVDPSQIRNDVRFKARSHYWRKAPSKNLISGQNDSCNPVSQGTQDKQLVEGIIDTGVFEKLKTSIIGTTKVVMEPEKLIELLENKGLREFEVRKLAGNQFLIDFDREELFDQCLNWEWVWLPEIFSDIIRWFKEASNLNKCVLEDEVDESSSSSFNSSCDVPRSVKTTPIQEKVSSVKDIPEAYLMSCGGYHKVEDVDSCKLDQLENVANSHGFGGCVSSEPLLGDVTFTSLNSVDVMGGCCTEPLSCLGVDAYGKNDIVTNQALEDIRNMGLGNEFNEELYEMIPCSNVGISWAKRVDMANGNTEAYAIESEAEPEQENFSPELQDLRSRRKYVSIAELQDKSLSAKEKRKRDQVECGFQSVSFHRSPCLSSRNVAICFEQKRCKCLRKQVGRAKRCDGGSFWRLIRLYLDSLIFRVLRRMYCVVQPYSKRGGKQVCGLLIFR